MSEILLVRHCESTGQAPDAPLADAGLQAAAELADVLESHAVDKLLSSPFRRALQTIAPFAARSGLPVHEDPRLAERTLSSVPREDWREQLRRTWVDFDYRVSGGETSREASVRGRRRDHGSRASLCGTRLSRKPDRVGAPIDRLTLRLRRLEPAHESGSVPTHAVGQGLFDRAILERLMSRSCSRPGTRADQGSARSAGQFSKVTRRLSEGSQSGS